MKAEKLDSRCAYAGRLLKVDIDTVRMPNGKKVELEMVRHPGAAAVVPLLSEPDSEDPHVLLQGQYRYAAEGMTGEMTAGVLEASEDPAECASSEVREVTEA